MTTCPVCAQGLYLQYRLSSNVLYCTSCKLYIAPEVRFDSSFKSGINQETAALALKDLRQRNFRIILHHLTTDLPANARGLDVGCSYGWFLDECKLNNLSCIGVEPEPDIAAKAKQSGHTIIQGFFPDDLYGQVSKVDFITFNDVFEHIPDIHKTLQSCYRLLSPDGVLMINLPLSTGLFNRAARILYYLKFKMPLERMWQFQFHSPHFHYFNKKNLVRLVQSKGFQLYRFHHLETISKDSIRSRIEMNKQQTVATKIIIALLKIIHPIIKKMPPDIGCFYFKKNAVRDNKAMR